MNNLTWLYRNGDWLTQSVITDVAIDYAVENGIEHDGIGEWLLAERNDDSTPKNNVSDTEVDVTTEKRSKTEHDGADSRAKLEDDANAIAIDYWSKKRTWGEANDFKREIIALLDRQAAITRAECERGRGCPGYDPARHYCKYHAQDFELNDRTVSRLKRENAGLARDLAECERMREGLRARLSEAIGKASEIAALGDL